MSLVSTGFVLFLFVGVIIYYVIPKRLKWAWLLIMSYAYYVCAGIKNIVFIVASTLITFITGIMLENSDNRLKDMLEKVTDKDEKKKIKESVKRTKKIIVLIALLLSFGILFVVKLNVLIIPLGISFYTFQSVGYVIDVYRGKFKANRNLFKLALFVSYFPQIMQGPIGRYDRLSNQLFGEHKFDIKNVQFGLQRVFWGLFKKFLVADRAAVIATAVFDNPTEYTGLYIIIGVLGYCAWLYGDFSGGIDIVMGVSEMFGIRLDDNFRQPLFSKSISEFWRRWHITLGTWMKDYVFYPFTLSKPMSKFGKFLKKHTNTGFGKHMAKVLPICIADLLVFFIVGVWHGTAWKFIVYGMYNGVIIALSAMLVPVYERMFKITHINRNAGWFNAFRILRTFVLVNIGWYFDNAASLSDAFLLMRNTLIGTSLDYTNVLEMCGGAVDLVLMLLGCMVWLVVSIFKEKNIDLRESISQKRIWVRWPIYLALVLSVLILGSVNESAGGFMYAQF